MKRYIQALVGIAAVVGLATSAHAGFAATDGFTTNNWQGAPNYFNYGAVGAINKSPGGAFVNEAGMGSGGAGGLGGLAQTVPITQAGMLNSVQLVLAGGAFTYNLYIYDLGLTSAYVPASSSTFNPSTTPLVRSYTGLSYTAANGGAQSVTKIDFTGADQVWLAAGEEYAFAIEATAGTAGTFGIARGGADTFASEQLYRLNQFSGAPGQYGAINGSGAPFRHAAIAVTVPEPTSVALLGLSALIGTFIIRRKA